MTVTSREEAADADVAGASTAAGTTTGRRRRVSIARQRSETRGGEDAPVMDVPSGFERYDRQGPFLEHVGPVHVRTGDGALVFGLRAEERHTNHRGTIQGGLLSTFADFVLGRAIEVDAGDGRGRATVSLPVAFRGP